MKVPLIADRPAPRGRPAQGHGHERLRPNGSSGRPWSSARPWRPSTTSSPARPRRSTSPTTFNPVRPVAVGQGRRAGRLRRGRRDADGDPAVRAPQHGRPADLRPDVRVHRTCCRATAPSSSPGAPTRSSTSRSRVRSRDHLGNVLYYLPAELTIHGKTTFRADLLRSTVVGTDSQIFSKDPTIDRLRSRQRDARLPPDRLRRTVHARPSWSITMNGDPNARRRRRSRSSRSRRSRRPARTSASTRHRQAVGPAARRTARQVFVGRGARGRAVRPRRPDVAPAAALQRGDALRRRRPDPLRRPDHRRPSSSATSTTGPTRSASRSTCRSRGTDRMTGIVRTQRPHQALRPDGRGGRHRPRHRRGRDLRPRRARTARARRRRSGCSRPSCCRRPGRPRSPAGRSPGTPTRSGASSGSCRTRSGSTTT